MGHRCGRSGAWLDGFWEIALDRYAERVREDDADGGAQSR